MCYSANSENEEITNFFRTFSSASECRWLHLIFGTSLLRPNLKNEKKNLTSKISLLLNITGDKTNSNNNI